MNVNELLDTIEDALEEGANVPLSGGKKIVDVEQIRDLESCKDKIFPRLIGTQWNEGLLNERPHMLIAGDLAVTFAIEIRECLDGSMSIPIHNRIAAEWNVTADELYDIALSNLEKADCGVVMSMKELLREGMINRLLIKFGGDRKIAEDSE